MPPLQRLAQLVRTMSTSSASSLASFSTCEISDALIKLGIPHGGHLPDIQMLSPSIEKQSETRLCGPAYTVQMVLSSDTSAPKLSSHFVDSATNGSVVVIDSPPRSVGPYFITALTPLKRSIFSACAFRHSASLVYSSYAELGLRTNRS